MVTSLTSVDARLMVEDTSCKDTCRRGILPELYGCENCDNKQPEKGDIYQLSREITKTKTKTKGNNLIERRLIK